jgi:hypothetical protein
MILRVVIPASYQVWGKLQRESSCKDWIPPCQARGRLDQVRNDVLCKVNSETVH